MLLVDTTVNEYVPNREAWHRADIPTTVHREIVAAIADGVGGVVGGAHRAQRGPRTTGLHELIAGLAKSGPNGCHEGCHRAGYRGDDARVEVGVVVGGAVGVRCGIVGIGCTRAVGVRSGAVRVGTL